MTLNVLMALTRSLSYPSPLLQTIRLFIKQTVNERREEWRSASDDVLEARNELKIEFDVENDVTCSIQMTATWRNTV